MGPYCHYGSLCHLEQQELIRIQEYIKLRTGCVDSLANGIDWIGYLVQSDTLN